MVLKFRHFRKLIRHTWDVSKWMLEKDGDDQLHLHVMKKCYKESRRRGKSYKQ